MTMLGRVRISRVAPGGRMGAIVLAALLAVAVLPVAGQAAETQWGWAVVRQPGANGYRITNPKDGRSSSGGRIKVERFRKGIHRITFKGVDGTGGNVQVSALTNGSGICGLVEWRAGTPVRIEVVCLDRRGFRRDLPFVVSYVAPDGPALTRFGYLLNLRPDQDHAPETQFITTGEEVTVGPDGVGDTTARFPGIGIEPGGNVQITPTLDRAACGATNSGQGGDDHFISVRCVRLDGSAFGSAYSLLFSDVVGLKYIEPGSRALLRADRARESSYVPNADYLSVTPSGKVRIRRLGKGRYEVTLKSMPLGGAAHVTADVSADGPGPLAGGTRCNVSGIGKSKKPLKIGVSCWNDKGTKRKDSKFYLSYAK